MTGDRYSSEREEKAVGITSLILHKYYCENDISAVIGYFDEPFMWLGAGEAEYAVGRDKAREIFRKLAGMVPRCNLSDEEYNACMLSPDICMVTGRVWISTAPEEGIALRVHQRITTVFRWRDDMPSCCHIHMSNPYVEMEEDDIDFPLKTAGQSSGYLRECIDDQKRKIAEQTKELASIYNTIPCAIARLLKKNDGTFSILSFNNAAASFAGCPMDKVKDLDWSEGYCTRIIAEDTGRMKSALKKLKKVGDTSHIDYKIDKGRGKWTALSCTNTVVARNEEGLIIQRIAFDITERIRLEEMLSQLSFRDSLTGLFNRNSFNHMLDSRPEGNGMLGIAYLDINGLKAANDRFGHSYGDRLIKKTADIIRKYFKDGAYRIGGDEFVIIDSRLDERKFTERVAQLCRMMEENGIHAAAGLSWRCGKECSCKEQFEETDRLMYQDKEAFYDGRKRTDVKKRASDNPA